MDHASPRVDHRSAVSLPVYAMAALSGLCALVYQTVWFREFRLLFGASTSANSAVVAVFMGGLGLGGLWLGARADRHPSPLRFYGLLELGVAGWSVLTPFLVAALRPVPSALLEDAGGGAATVVRLVLSALVLGVPTTLMGATLAAAGKAVQRAKDESRAAVGLLYGVNTLGAVTGCALSTLWLVEALGNHKALFCAAALNALVGASAVLLSGLPAFRGLLNPQASETAAPDAAPDAPAQALPTDARPQVRITLVAAAVVGFVFMALELVWYRMLSPILGGTVFTFGLILSTALLGIGAGAAAYGAFPARARAANLAFTCALEALLIMVPYALGDGLAVVAGLLRPLAALGFAGDVLGWAAVTSVAVLPVALVSGYQFPLLMALLGGGSRGVGRDVGLAYAANTLGSMAGSLAFGFVLIPLLGATLAWQLLAGLLGLTALVLLVTDPTRTTAPIRSVATVGLVLVQALVTGMTRGPTSAWRHSGIGMGRSGLDDVRTRPQLDTWLRGARAASVLDEDGVESSVAVRVGNGHALYVNGKADGSLVADAATQVMLGLLGGLFVPEARTSLVVGLGTGSTAGWLGRMPAMERVDAVELEPQVVAAAQLFRSVNEDALRNGRVLVIVGDARERLTVTDRRYDIISSEPSNPFRAGVANLFTREFYGHVRSRLNPGGVFVQWVQGYEIRQRTFETILKTLLTEFPHVSVWWGCEGDLLLVATEHEQVVALDRWKQLVATEPWNRALAAAWRVNSVEGVLSHHVANAVSMARLAAASDAPLNVDDLPVVEFGFAQALGSAQPFSPLRLLEQVRPQGGERAVVAAGGSEVDWAAVEEERLWRSLVGRVVPELPPNTAAGARARVRAGVLQQQGRAGDAVLSWRSQDTPAQNPTAMVMLAQALAESGAEPAASLMERLRAFSPVEADAVDLLVHLKAGRKVQAQEAAVRVFGVLRESPWMWASLVQHALTALPDLAARDAAVAQKMLSLVEQPLAGGLMELVRRRVALSLAVQTGSTQAVVAALEPMEPDFPLEEGPLRVRVEAYRITQDPLLPEAQADLDAVLRQR